MFRLSSVETLMVSPAFVNENDNIVKIAKRLLQTKKGCVFVRRLDKVVGIITDRDFQRYIVKEGGIISPEVKARNLMISPVISVPITASIEDADHLMHSENIKRLAVVDEENSKNVVGLIDYNTTHSKILTQFASSVLSREKSFR